MGIIDWIVNQFFVFFFFCCKINYFELKERYRPPEDKLIVRSDFRLISVNTGKEANERIQELLAACIMWMQLPW